jgi:hypothetical protein
MSLAYAANGDIYAVCDGGIYKQYGGEGDFITLNQPAYNWSCVLVLPNKDVYAGVLNGDVYVQIGGEGDFTALGLTHYYLTGLSYSPVSGNLYGTVTAGEIQKRVGNTGDWVEAYYATRYWYGTCVDLDNNVYASNMVSYGGGDMPGIYTQNNETGDFSLSFLSGFNCDSLTVNPVNGDVYVATSTFSSEGQIYRKPYGGGNFISMYQTNRLWRGITATPSGIIYAAEYGGDIYRYGILASEISNISSIQNIGEIHL